MDMENNNNSEPNSSENNVNQRHNGVTHIQQQTTLIDTFVNAEGVELPLLMIPDGNESTGTTPSGSTTVVSIHDGMITAYNSPRRNRNNNIINSPIADSQTIRNSNVIAPDPPSRTLFLGLYTSSQDGRDTASHNDSSNTSSMFIRNNNSPNGASVTNDGFICYPDMPGR